MLRTKLIARFVLSSLALCLLTTTSHAADNGFYVGGQLGWGNIHQGGITGVDMRNIIIDAIGTQNIVAFSPLETSDDNDDGIAGRLFFGYQYNCYYGAEIGWTKFKNMSTGASATALDAFGFPITANASGTIRTDALDLVIKGTQSLQYGLSVWGKLGVAYLYERGSASGTITDGFVTFSGSRHESQGQVYPTFGIGLAYDITNQFVTDLSWMRIQEASNSDVSSTDLFSLGLIYHIS